MTPGSQGQDAATVAAAFVGARLQARSLAAFPGPVPASMAQGYAIQDAAIARWPDHVAGWKVGFIASERRDAEGDDRVTGPIFSRAVWKAGSEPLDFPVFGGGFAAVEAEFVFRLAHDAPPDRLDWTDAQAADIAGALFTGVETAGSPLATINVLGPTVVASDFGNNNGLILGREITGWRELDETALRCETWIEGECVGKGGAASIPGGLLGAFAFALGRCARRGLPMRAGCLVTTGAATGIHDIRAGQSAIIKFGPWGEIACRAVAALPATERAP